MTTIAEWSDRIEIALSDNEDDDAEAERAAIQDLLGSRFSVEFTGSGNTDADGYTTSDVVITVAEA